MAEEQSATSTRDKILASGMRYFSEYGFKSAPLREIVKDAGYTLGAFYGYYKTKEELFYALTEETALGFTAIVRSIGSDMDKLPPDKMIYSMVDCYIARLPELVDYICTHKAAFTLLLRGAEGTKYENFMDTFRTKNLSHVAEAKDKAVQTGDAMSALDPQLFNLLMQGYFDMLARIVLEIEDAERICRMMRDVALVYKNGMLSLMKGADNYE